MNTEVHFSSNKKDWRTPENVLELVREFGRGTIDLDPCTSFDNPTAAARFYTPEENGLLQPWETGAGLIYFNPPYGRGIGSWTYRAAVYADCDQHIIGLVPARTDTNWFRTIWDSADAVCFIKGRLTFVGAAHPAPFPSAMPYWGRNRQSFYDIFSSLGHVVTL